MTPSEYLKHLRNVFSSSLKNARTFLEFCSRKKEFIPVKKIESGTIMDAGTTELMLLLSLV